LTALTQKTSGRVAAILMIVALAATLVLIALRPARADSVGPIPNSGYTCPSSTLGFFFEIPSGGDPDRVFTETYPLDDGASLTVEVQTNRKVMDFDIEDAKVNAVAVYDKTNLRSGNLYTYDPGVSSGTVETPGERNIKAVRVCYQTKADPTVSTSATEYAVAGEVISDTATLVDGDEPDGLVEFKLYAADECDSGTPKFTGSAPVSYDEETGYTATVDFDTPDDFATGTYLWVAQFKGDDRNNPQPPGACGDEGESTEIYATGLGCNETIDKEGDEGDIATFAIVVRGEPTLGDDDTKFDCEGTLPATLEITSTNVQLLFPEEFEGANLIIKIDWANEDNEDEDNEDDGPDNLVVGTVRDVDANDDGVYDPGQGCASSDLGPGELPLIDENPDTPLTVATHPSGVPICLVAQVLNGYQTQYWSIKIDPAWR
jgi:hypothetical protein